MITKEDVDMLAGSRTEAAEALFLLEKVRGCWPVDKLTKAHKVRALCSELSRKRELVPNPISGAHLGFSKAGRDAHPA